MINIHCSLSKLSDQEHIAGLGSSSTARNSTPFSFRRSRKAPGCGLYFEPYASHSVVRKDDDIPTSSSFSSSSSSKIGAIEGHPVNSNPIKGGLLLDDARLVLQIHDELVYEVRRENLDAVSCLLISLLLFFFFFFLIFFFISSINFRLQL